MPSSTNEQFPDNLEEKRRQNLEDNRRFLATLKINDIRNEIKEITNATNHMAIESVNSHQRRMATKESQSDRVRRSSRIRKNIESVSSTDDKKKKTTTKKKVLKTTDENQINPLPKVKLQLPEHMLIRYQSTGKKVALHNTKTKFGDDENTWI